MTAIDEIYLHKIKDLNSLLTFLREPDPARGLNWPIRNDVVDAEELFYDYSQGEFIRAGGESLKVYQLANLTKGQPWGIFLLQTASPKLYMGQLRRLLRTLAAKKQLSFFPNWQITNILFVATYKFERFTFAHFSGEETATAKLRSFGWNRAEGGVRTLCEYNLPALRWPDNPDDHLEWLDQWSSAFDVEKVTDLFFKEFRDLFESLKENLPAIIKRPSDRHAFVQRLLNRLLFLSFLQKKRWLKAPHTPRPSATYLFDLYDRAKEKKENFYSDYLQDLFFNALNRPPQADGAPNPFAVRLGVVPFLNGGLFDRVDEWDTSIKLKLPNDFFERILGEEGLLRKYNFTVTESTPLNQEVAVDPEMIGKVFETVVLTSEGAENYQAPNLRKATGSFYTPRIVVTFNVREALQSDLCAHIPELQKSTLKSLMEMDALSGISKDVGLSTILPAPVAQKILERLKDLRACDPAIGSGAFALGLLHELLNLRLLCEISAGGKDPRHFDPNAIFNFKKSIIEQNIYGVDLQAKAVEICKLRLWLSLIVDYELEADAETSTPEKFAEAVRKIPALPNLAFKIKRGDSLLDLVQGKPFRMKEITHSPDMQKAVDDLTDAHMRFFAEDDPQEKRQLRLKALTSRTTLNLLQLEQQVSALEDRNATQGNMFAAKETKATIQARQTERKQLEAVLAKVRETQAELDAIAKKKYLGEDDDATITRLEATSESDDITFTWELDFPEIFFEQGASASTLTGKMGFVNQTRGQTEFSLPTNKRGGFDLMLGNPPFVTARNEEKRKAYFERWPLTCFKNYQLVAPFFERSFSLLHSNGHLGFIVSNAFAKREFGQPLVEKFFPTIELKKIVDCSGLLFPGHGTPTCIVFGRNRNPENDSTIRVTATLPGGGDLRTMPEHSLLWYSISSNYDTSGYLDDRISVQDWKLTELAKWPWNFERTSDETRKALEKISNQPLVNLIDGSIGHQAISRTDDAFIIPLELARKSKIEYEYLKFLGTGETIRDWSPLEYELCVFPYDGNLRPLNPKKAPNCIKYLEPFRSTLENVVMHGSVKKKETNVQWFEYSRVSRAKFTARLSVVMPEIATHNHAVVDDGKYIFHQTVPAIKFAPETPIEYHHLISGLLNSSANLFWLKQVCFNKNAGEEQERDRFVYAGGKVEQLPVPQTIFKN